MRDARLRLEWIRGAFAVCRLPPTDDVPEWATAASSAKRLLIVTRTDKELSVVIGQEAVPEDVTTERGWVAMRISDSLDLSMTGVLSTLTGALAESGVSVFAVSTYDTDILLVKSTSVGQAVEALSKVADVSGLEDSAVGS